MVAVALHVLKVLIVLIVPIALIMVFVPIALILVTVPTVLIVPLFYLPLLKPWKTEPHYVVFSPQLAL